jgi:hypothetical protein
VGAEGVVGLLGVMLPLGLVGVPLGLVGVPLGLVGVPLDLVGVPLGFVGVLLGALVGTLFFVGALLVQAPQETSTLQHQTVAANCAQRIFQ